MKECLWATESPRVSLPAIWHRITGPAHLFRTVCGANVVNGQRSPDLRTTANHIPSGACPECIRKAER